ncbi:MAG TPA: GNAT family N-acetyltransferase, partial [Roseiflexaceae bacterium]|nr:GNAT family N-acetyltransferase [Roseiflexaceae bacterium]
ARRVRFEQIDLYRSLVMTVDDAPAGQMLLGLRGDHAWCGGFGVLAPFRGQGLAATLATAMIDSARQAGARRFSLEVLTRNERAIRTYTRAGLRTQHDLQIFEWRRPDVQQHDAPAPHSPDRRIEETSEPLRLLEHFAAFHPVKPAWQRDLPALLARASARGLALTEGGAIAGYLLFQLGADGLTRIEDLGARNADHVGALLTELQARSSRIVSVNEPDNSPLTAAFEACGFVESDRQHEMWRDLT